LDWLAPASFLVCLVLGFFAFFGFLVLVVLVGGWSCAVVLANVMVVSAAARAMASAIFFILILPGRVFRHNFILRLSAGKLDSPRRLRNRPNSR
jgi:hypothetical protein